MRERQDDLVGRNLGRGCDRSLGVIDSVCQFLERILLQIVEGTALRDSREEISISCANRKPEPTVEEGIPDSKVS